VPFVKDYYSSGMLFIASSNFVIRLSAHNRHKVPTTNNVLNKQVILPHACGMYMEILA